MRRLAPFAKHSCGLFCRCKGRRRVLLCGRQAVRLLLKAFSYQAYKNHHSISYGDFFIFKRNRTLRRLAPFAKHSCGLFCRCKGRRRVLLCGRQAVRLLLKAFSYQAYKNHHSISYGDFFIFKRNRTLRRLAPFAKHSCGLFCRCKGREDLACIFYSPIEIQFYL